MERVVPTQDRGLATRGEKLRLVMKVLISANILGGAGGAERALYSILHALGGDGVDLVVRRRLPGELAAVPDGVRVRTPTNPRWWGASHTGDLKAIALQQVINPMRRLSSSRYDVYLQFFAGAYVAPAARCGLRLLVPSGNKVPQGLASRFDFVAMQAPGNEALLDGATPRLLLPPPVLDLPDGSEGLHQSLPEEFFLTVFNPYDPIKGVEDLRTALRTTPLPIVWCHSDRSLSFDIPGDLANHPSVVHVCDATAAQLRHLYERTQAYLSFSRTEGFGWATADALRYSRAVVTRPIGIFSNQEAWQEGTFAVGHDWTVDWGAVLATCGDAAARRDLDWMSAAHFRERLLAITRGNHDG